MKLIRCSTNDMSYALEAIRVVKHEEDNNKLELLTDECMTNFLSNPDNYLIIAIGDNIVAGFVVAYELQRVDRNQKLMFLYEIGVLKTHRKKGIGTVLINFLKGICEDNNIMKMWVPTERSNIPAVSLYTKTGGEVSTKANEVSFTWYPPFEES